MPQHFDIGEADHQRLLTRFGRPADRRSFLKWSGAAGASLVLAGCGEDQVGPAAPAPTFDSPRGTHFLPPSGPSNDTEILQFALLLELLEAEFYTLAVDSGVLSGKVLEVSTNVRDHELDHVAFLQTTLSANSFDQDDVVFDFSGAFKNQNKFLDAAEAFEQTGVGAYLGALPLISDPVIAEAASTIFTIEARHTAAFRAMNHRHDPVPAAFETPLTPSQVVSRISPFLVSAVGTP
ncbi:ferritin-like domain-containing protein [soil metagenome]